MCTLIASQARVSDSHIRVPIYTTGRNEEVVARHTNNPLVARDPAPIAVEQCSVKFIAAEGAQRETTVRAKGYCQPHFAAAAFET